MPDNSGKSQRVGAQVLAAQNKDLGQQKAIQESAGLDVRAALALSIKYLHVIFPLKPMIKQI